jgi:hypothetical protein
LTEVQNNIALNTDLIERQITVINNLNSTSDTVFSCIEKKPKYDAVFEEDFYYCFFSETNIYLSKNGFEAFKNAGFQNVKNNQFRKAIIDLFGVKNLKHVQFIEYIIENFKIYESYLIQNFYTEEHRLIPIDYQLLLADPQFLAIVKRMKERRTRILNNLNNNLEENLSVLVLLKEELGEPGN